MAIPPALRMTDDQDWPTLTLDGRFCLIELERYLQIPGLITAKESSELKLETVLLETRAVGYGVHQQEARSIESSISGNSMAEKNQRIWRAMQDDLHLTACDKPMSLLQA